MAANRTLYLLALSGAIAFYAAAGEVWFSWAVVFLLLALPVVSLLVSLPQMLHLRLSLSVPEKIEQGERVLLRFQTRSYRLLPMPELRLRLRTQTRGDLHQELRLLTRIPRENGSVWLSPPPSGLLICSAKRVRVYDYLGLIWLPKKLQETARVAVLPAAAEPAVLPDLSFLRSAQLVSLPAGSYSELHDHRPYRDGDNVRSIHWKLSQKSNDLIVREPVAPVRLRCALLLTPPQSLAALRSELAQLRFLSLWMLSQEIPHSVFWADETGTHCWEISDASELPSLLASVCAMPLDGRAIPQPQQTDWYWRIEPGGEVRA